MFIINLFLVRPYWTKRVQKLRCDFAFSLASTPTVISGSVSPAYSGVTIDLYASGGTLLLESVATDGNGTFAFPPHNPGEYVVTVVEPLGFTVDPSQRTVNLIGMDVTLDAFPLAAIPTANNARSMGYWKHQVNADITGKGNRDYEGYQLLELTQDILDHFYSNGIEPIRVEGASYFWDSQPIPNATALLMPDMEVMLNINQGGNTPMYDKACQQFLALLLNVVSGNLSQLCQASVDGVTVSQVIVYISADDGLLATGENDELAKDISETLNQGQMIAEGIIPEPIMSLNIIFSDDIEALVLPNEFTFRFLPPAPNPFNPMTVFTLELPEAQ